MKATNDLYFATFLSCIGAELIETRGTYPRVVFVFKEGGLIYWIRRKLKLVNWYQFKQKRLELKIRTLDGTLSKSKTMKEMLEVWKNAREED
jgi:hypothetical protein